MTRILNDWSKIEFDENQKSGIGVTIGNFDGVHLGHQSLLKNIKIDCDKNNLSFLVITFQPHPMEIIAPQNNFFIFNQEQKVKALKDLGVDFVFFIEFTRDFSTISPGDFLDKYILPHPKIKKLYLGHDFTFGAQKKGNFEFAKNYCEKKGIEVLLQQKFILENLHISSSEIRNYLKNGDIEKANKLLGRKFYITGSVVKGDGRGKKIGFPTANLKVEEKYIVPTLGVYLTQTKFKGKIFPSITNIGKRPTFEDLNPTISIETHLLDFNNDLYGETLEVLFEKKVRDEKKFPHINALVEQIKIDVDYAKKYWIKS